MNLVGFTMLIVIWTGVHMEAHTNSSIYTTPEACEAALKQDVANLLQNDRRHLKRENMFYACFAKVHAEESEAQ